jgi:hypothetical protein
MIFQAKKHLVLIPIFGSAVYVLLYIIATLYYPGGSQIDKNSIGFSWINNYWCNLLNDTAINGQPNPAKPIAIAGMLVLCITLAYFWWLFSNRMNLSKKWKYAVRISGTLSMFIAFFLFTDLDHDLVTNLASFFGMIATVGTFIGLYRSKWMILFLIGLLNILMVCLNNYVYYTKGLIIFLPLIQKLSFVAFLIWICWIDVQIFRLKV